MMPASGPLPGAESDIGRIEQALSMIVFWGTRHDVQQETMRRAQCDLPRGHIWLLGRLSQGDGARLSEVAHSFGVDKSSLTPQAGRLLREGLIARQADPADRRAAILYATPAGRELLARLHSTRSAMLSELLAGWPAGEQASTAAVLTRLAAVLDASAPLGPRRELADPAG
jgi:DNA-binding MarR family transcriptional regulator